MVVGAGAVAVRRARALVEAGADVTVIGLAVSDAFDDLSVKIECGAYQSDDLEGALLVVIATDDREVNERAAADARSMGLLVNRADEPTAGDFVVPAHRRRGPITVAVSTDGISASAARELVERCEEAIDDEWRILLEAAEPMRARMQAAIADGAARQAALRRLTDEQAIRALRDGGAAGLAAHLEAVLREATGQTKGKAGDDAA